MESDGDHFLAYYLTRDNAPAELFKDSRFLDDTNPVRARSLSKVNLFTETLTQGYCFPLGAGL
jgi:hypothetical protein